MTKSKILSYIALWLDMIPHDMATLFKGTCSTINATTKYVKDALGPLDQFY